jgi:beta-lactamase superfamily II metal-dependent hydrolase
LEINVLDLRSGAAAHVRTAQCDWLFDAGPARDYDRVVRQYLRSRGVNRLDGIALTHGDASHIGGAEGVLLDFRPRQFIDTAASDRSPIHRKLSGLVGSGSNARKVLAPGDAFELSRDVEARMLFPPRDSEAKRADDKALVIRLLVAGKSKALLLSDSGAATEDFLLKNYPDLRADVVIKGQHHSGISGSSAFLDAVRPQAIIATSRDFPENERIKGDWADAVRARGIKLFRQDETGEVQLRFFRDRWEANCYATGETFRSTSR